MRPWLANSLIALALWGLWGFLGRLASRSMSPRNLMLLGSIGSALVMPLFLLAFRKEVRFQWSSVNCHYAVLGGVVGAVGALFFYYALARGEASRVVAVTALYPVVTVVLARLFLGEPLTAPKVAGLVLAMAGIVLLAR